MPAERLTTPVDHSAHGKEPGGQPKGAGPKLTLMKAICAVTIAFRSRTPPNAVPLRSLSEEISTRRPACRAGAKPLRTPAATSQRRGSDRDRTPLSDDYGLSRAHR